MLICFFPSSSAWQQSRSSAPCLSPPWAAAFWLSIPSPLTPAPPAWQTQGFLLISHSEWLVYTFFLNPPHSFPWLLSEHPGLVSRLFFSPCHSHWRLCFMSCSSLESHPVSSEHYITPLDSFIHPKVSLYTVQLRSTRPAPYPCSSATQARRCRLTVFINPKTNTWFHLHLSALNYVFLPPEISILCLSAWKTLTYILRKTFFFGIFRSRAFLWYWNKKCNIFILCASMTLIL